jgi:hypothetical protein
MTAAADRVRIAPALTLAATLLAAAALALPSATHAQRVTLVGTRSPAVAASQADVLDARAAALEDTHSGPQDLLTSAVLRESAAELRAPTDARGLASLRRAAFARYYAADTVGAVALLEDVAFRAAALRHVAQALTAYLDAASVELELRHPERARRQLGKAIALAERAATTQQQRAELRAEIARRFRP